MLVLFEYYMGKYTEFLLNKLFFKGRKIEKEKM